MRGGWWYGVAQQQQKNTSQGQKRAVPAHEIRRSRLTPFPSCIHLLYVYVYRCSHWWANETASQTVQKF